jgi:hypothetical protein
MSEPRRNGRGFPQALILALTVSLLIGSFLLGALLRGGGGRAEATTTTTTTATTLTPSTEPPTTPPPTTATTEPETTTSTSEPETTTTAASTALTLRATGLGDLAFGTDADTAIAALIATIGPADEDSGWIDAFSGFGSCPGTQVRVVRWVSLEAFFSDGPTDWAPASTPHLFHYSHSISAGGGESLDLATEAGVRLGSTVLELKTAYGDGVLIVDDPLFGVVWEVDVAGPGILWGTASAPTDEGTVDSINGGTGCGE